MGWLSGVLVMVEGSCWMLISDLRLGETERDFKWNGEDICKEYIVTMQGVGWTNVDAR